MICIGVASMIGIQTGINLGGLTGLIPITGVTLPFISYGGSSLLTLMVSMGIIVNISFFVNYQNKNRKIRKILCYIRTIHQQQAIDFRKNCVKSKNLLEFYYFPLIFAFLLSNFAIY